MFPIFQKYWVSAVILQKWRNLGFLNTENAIILTALCVFMPFDYTITSDNLIYICKYRSWFRETQHWLTLIQRWKLNNIARRQSALRNTVSEPIVSETGLFSADLFKSEQPWLLEIRTDRLWFSADQRWFFAYSLIQSLKMSNLWSMSVQRWLSLGFQSGLF